MTGPGQDTGPFRAHRPVVMGTRGMVVAGHHVAAEAGAAVLRRGGNAVDAAVATAAALAMAVPFMNGLGGDCMALYARDPTTVVAINGSGAVGRGQTVAAIRARGHMVMPQRGAVTVSVPGFVAALGETLERHGTMRFAEVIEPAVAIASEGVPADMAAVTFFNGPNYADLVHAYPALGVLFGVPGTLRLGDRIRQTAAAATLRVLARDGWRSFYSGDLAQAWLTQAWRAGVLLDETDLASHRTEFAESISTEWRGWAVHAAPPNAQGLALLGLLALAPPDGNGGAAADPLLDPATWLVQKRIAFAVRDAYCADRRRVPLLPPRLDAAWFAAAGRAHLALQPRPGSGDTSTFVVIDHHGQTVSWVQSLFDEFGSGVACPDHGIVLHNRASLERLDDDAVRGLRPGYRPFHTLCPALAFSSGGGTIAIATPGDHGQPQAIAQVLCRHLEQGLDIQSAIEWPRLRHDAGTDVMLEDRCPAAWDDLLEAAGWSCRRVGPWSRLMGGVNAIRRRPDGLLMGGADPRRSCYAIAT